MYYYIHISERIYSDLCRVKRIFYRNPKPLNGHAPFFFTILDPLDKNERICSDFYALFKPILAIIVGGLNRSDWVGMLRFQHYYKEYVCKHLKHLFPRQISYNRFVELEKEVLLPMTIFIKKVLLETCIGISFVDSTPLRVCRNQRILIHKTFEGLAERGKCSMG